jgi:hypothetical protein
MDTIGSFSLFADHPFCFALRLLPMIWSHTDRIFLSPQLDVLRLSCIIDAIESQQQHQKGQRT